MDSDWLTANCEVMTLGSLSKRCFCQHGRQIAEGGLVWVSLW